MSVTKSNLMMTGAILLVISLAVGLLYANQQSIILAFNGKLSHGKDIGYFAISGWRQAWVAVLILMTVFAPLLLQRSLTRLEEDYSVSQQQAVVAKKQLADFGERMHGAVTRSLEDYDRLVCELGNRLTLGRNQCETNHKLREISQRLADAEKLLLSSGEVAVMGSGTGQIGTLKTNTREVYVFDPKTAEETLVVIVHVFDGVAYWEYEESSLFVELDDKTDVNLWRQLKTAEAIEQLGKFDLVAGVGLESNTGDLHPNISALRAGTLCTGLNTMFANSEHTTAVGLDIGMYRGDLRESKLNRDPQLRPVILVGINAKKHADYASFLQELLAKVKVPKLDLGRFENLREGQRPIWVYPPNCRPDFDFVGAEGD